MYSSSDYANPRTNARQLNYSVYMCACVYLKTNEHVVLAVVRIGGAVVVGVDVGVVCCCCCRRRRGWSVRLDCFFQVSGAYYFVFLSHMNSLFTFVISCFSSSFLSLAAFT